MTITESSTTIENRTQSLPVEDLETQVEDQSLPVEDLETQDKESTEGYAEESEFDQEHLLHGASVTVVFPCLNEEYGVASCVKTALRAMQRAGVNGSVLVVDNGSTDNSAKVAVEAGAEVLFEREPGYGAALRAGIEASQSEFVIMADADGTYELDAIPRLLLPLLRDEADMVLGQRLTDATSATMPWLHRYVGTPAITFLVKKATKSKVNISDSQSGFRAFRRSQILSLNLSSTGMEFASEMLIRSSWANMRISEVETKYAERIGDSKLSTFSDGLRHLRQILLLSPETAASIPGLLATGVAVLLWLMASQSSQGLAQVGSLSWVADVCAGVLSILGPLVFCTGIVLRYRAETLGLRSSHVKVPLENLIRRFFIWGLIFVSASALGLTSLLISFHESGFLSKSVAGSLSSFVISAFVVGIMLTSAPIIAPFLITSQRSRQTVVDAGSQTSLMFHGHVEAKDGQDEYCLYCLGETALREA